jgi:transcriptional regulator with XRE-family HTH domain
MENHMLERERVRLRRVTLRLSQQQLGSQIGHDQGYISRLERGEITEITARTLARLADALDVSIDYLMNRTDDPTPPKKRPRSRTSAPVG